MSKKILLGMIILFSALSARANDSLNVRQVGSWPFFSCKSVALDTSTAQKLAVLSVGGGLFIVDITDPLHPDKIGEINLNNSYSYILEINDHYAYCLSDSLGLSIVDYSNPHLPVLVGQCLFKEGKNQALAIIGNYIYACIDYYGIKIIDISDPTNPIEKNHFPNTYISTDILVKDTLAYYAGDSLIVLNVSDPENPTLIGAGDVTCGNFAIRDTFLYGSIFGGINVYNISDPARPVCIGNGGSVVTKFTLYDSLILSPAQIGGYPFYINSLSNPIAPVLVSQCSTYCSRDVAAYNGYAYVADDREGLKVIDINNPADPAIVGYCPTPYNEDNKILFDNGNIYLPATLGGLRIIDASDPASLQETGCSFYQNKENRAVDVLLQDTIAFVSDRNNGLRIINISDKTDPVEVCSLSFNGYPYKMALKDSLLFIGLCPEYSSGDSASIRIVNISNVKNPTETGHFCLPGSEALDILIKNAYLFVSTNTFSVYDISDPLNPVSVYYNDTLGSAWNMAIKDTLLFVANSAKGLSILNVADPSNPQKISSVPSFKNATGVFVDSGFAYMVDDTFGIKVINITDPKNPVVTGYYLFNYDDPFIYYMFFPYVDITVNNKNIFITHPTNILQALEYYGPDAGVSSNDRDSQKKPFTFLLRDAYPNPARSKTNICYQLPNKSVVKLNLYNVAGQLVQSTNMGTQQPGYYNIPLKTDKLSSGVYFYKLTAGNDSKTGKFVVLK